MWKWLQRNLDEFKKFAMRGNVLDLAVGVIIGGAFGKIVTSVVNDIIMPPIGLILGKVNFSNLYINLSGVHYASLAEAQAAGAPTINYGSFLNNLIDFLIVAAIVFAIVRIVNHLRLGEEVKKEIKTKHCHFCYTDIPVKATRCPNCTSKL